MKTYEHGNRRAWYDPHLRMWTMQTVDAHGAQVGEVEYDFDRARVMAWLKPSVVKIKLTPPDRKRCQAERRQGCFPTAAEFMILGPGQYVRCGNKPIVIATENKPGADGLIGSMSLCDECAQAMVRLKGAGYCALAPIKATRR